MDYGPTIVTEPTMPTVIQAGRTLASLAFYKRPVKPTC